MTVLEPSPLLHSGDTITLVPLSIAADADGVYCIGDPASGEFVVMPEEGAYLIEQLSSGSTIGEAESAFTGKFGQAPDMADFIDTMIQLNFVTSVGATAVSTSHNLGRGIALLGSLSARRCRWLLSRTVTVIAFAGWIAMPLLLLLGGHIPSATDVAVYPHLLFLFAVFVPAGWVILCLHELCHSLTARALGCPAYTRFGNRMWYLVCETDLSSIYSLPRRRRYRPLLAGITSDVLILDLCLTLQIAGLTWRPPRVLAYMIFAGLTYQACIFLRTDLYFTFTTATGLDNLVPRARTELRHLADLALRRSPTARQEPESGRARLMIRLYLVACIAGVALGIITITTLVIPANIKVLGIAISALHQGPKTFDFWSSIFVMAFIPAVYSLLGWTFIRNRRESSNTERTATPETLKAQ